MREFEIRVAERVLDDLAERLEKTRWPQTIEDSGWAYGTDAGYLKELCDYWRYGYDWRAAEQELNGHAHYIAGIDGTALHFVHERSPHEDALPLLVTHGWPGSVYEFHKILGPLTNPQAHGGSASDAFHVVCPSIPGYGWSEAPREPGWDVKRMAEVEAALMAELGYEHYGVQGGDWGGLVSPWIALTAPDAVCGVHLNMVIARPPDGFDPEEDTEGAKYLAAMKDYRQREMAYAHIQSTKPQTLGVALNDSPAGLAAWIVEKFHAWSDCGGEIESRFTRDELLTNIMIYWITGSIASSTRLYFETMASDRWGPPGDFVDTPTAGAIFPHEIARPPRHWAENYYNVARWTEFDRGGHFAALEEPALLVEDVRAFFRTSSRHAR